MQHSFMQQTTKLATVLAVCMLLVVAWSLGAKQKKAPSQPSSTANDAIISNYAQEMLTQGKQIFRSDTFGDEAFWGDTLHLHQAIAGEHLGGVGPQHSKCARAAAQPPQEPQ
jgi:hypothetical protein